MSRTCNFFDKVLCSISCNSLANPLNQTKSKINVSHCAKLKTVIDRTKSSGKYKKFRAARRFHKSGRLRSDFAEVATSNPKCKMKEASPFYRSLYSYKRPHKIKSPEKRFRHLHYDDTDIIQFSRKINAFRACRNTKDKIAWPPIYKYKGEPKRKISPLPFKRLYKKKFVKKQYQPEELQPIYPTKSKPVSEVPKQERIEVEPEKAKEAPEKKQEEVESLKNKIKIHKESNVAVDNIKRMQYKFEKLSKTNNILMGQYLKMSIEKELEDLKKTSPKVFTSFVNENPLIDMKKENRNEVKHDLKPIYPKIEFENEKGQNDEEKVRFTVVEKLLEQKNTRNAAEQEKERLQSSKYVEVQNKLGKRNSIIMNSKSKQNLIERKEKLKTRLSNEKFLQHPSGSFNNILFRTMTTDAKDKKPFKLKSGSYEPLYRFKKDEPKAFKMKKLPEKYHCNPEPMSKMQKNVASLKKLIQEKLGRESKKTKKVEIPATAVCATIHKIRKNEIPKEKKPRFDITPKMTSPNIVDGRPEKSVKKIKFKKKPKTEKTVIKDVFQSEEPLKIKKDETCKDTKIEETPKKDAESLKNKICACANDINIEVNLKKEAKKAEQKCAPKVEESPKVDCALEVQKCPNVKDIEENLMKELRSEVKKACEKSINELKTEFSKACLSIREQKTKSLKRKKPCLTETLEELYSASIKEVENISKCLEQPKRSKFDEIISKITGKIYSKKEPQKVELKEKPKSRKRRPTPEKHVFKNPNVFDCRDRSKGNFKVEISADVPIKVEKDGQFIHATISLPKTEKKKYDKDKKLIVPILQVAAAAATKDKDQNENSKKPKKELCTCPPEEPLLQESEQQIMKSNAQTCPNEEDARKKDCAELCPCQGQQDLGAKEPSQKNESSEVPVCSCPKEPTVEPIINEISPNPTVEAVCCIEQEKKEAENNERCDDEEEEKTCSESFIFRPNRKNDQSKDDLKAIRSTFARGGRKTCDPTDIIIPEVHTSHFHCQEPFLKCFLSPDSETIRCLVDSRQKPKPSEEEPDEKPTKERMVKFQQKKDPVFNHRCITVPKSAYRLKLPTETANYEKTWYTDMTKNTKTRRNSSVQVHK